MKLPYSLNLFCFISSSAILGSATTTANANHDLNRFDEALASENSNNAALEEDAPFPHHRRRAKKSSKVSSAGGGSSGSGGQSNGGKNEETSSLMQRQFRVLIDMGLNTTRALDAIMASPMHDLPGNRAAAMMLESLVVEEEEGLCHSGTNTSVIDRCGLDCCVGKDACVWEGEATVCVTSCLGQNSCKNITTGAIIYPSSCMGNYACENLGGGDSAPAGTTVTVGFKACAGRSACADVGPQAASVAIGYDACVAAEYSCDKLGYATTGDITIGDSACRWLDDDVDSLPCENMDAKDFIEVGDYSCSGYGACNGIGSRGPAKHVSIGTNSCIEEDYPCYRMGNDIADEYTITVGDGSCVNESACESLGRSIENGNIAIGSEACIGEESCYHVAYGPFTGLTSFDANFSLVSIGDRACVGKQICYTFGSGLKGDGNIVSIADDACTEIGDVCGAQAQGGEACDASSCAVGSNFEMPTDEVPCGDLCPAATP